MNYTKLAFIIAATLLASNPAQANALATVPRQTLRIPFSPVVVGLAALGITYAVYQHIAHTLQQRLQNINQSRRQLGLPLTPQQLEDVREDVRIEEVMKAFLARTQPCPELARPGVQHRDNSNGGPSWRRGKDNPLLTATQRSLTVNEKDFASMLGGYKNVFSPFNSVLDLFDESTQQAILKKSNITTITWINSAPSPDTKKILCTQKGRLDAYLYIKYQHSSSYYDNSYIIGYLLGYSSKDIDAFYRHRDKDAPTPITQAELNTMNEDALKWITEHKKTITQWIYNNKTQLHITFS